MGCQVSTNQAPQQPTTVLPANLPQNQGDWSRFIQRMQEVLSAIHAAGYTTGVNVVPTQYSIYDGTALPGLRLTGATSSLDSANVQFGAASLKLVATGTQIVLTLAASGYPATMQPYWKWLASLYCRTDQSSLSGKLAVVTAAATYSDDISGAVTASTWSRLYGNYDLTADASTACTITLTLNTVANATYWLEAWQLEPVQGNTALPSPFIFTSPPRTWAQVVNDGNKPANGADVTSQNTANDTAHVNGSTASAVSDGAGRAQLGFDVNGLLVNGRHSIDLLADGTTYARIYGSDLTSNRLDFSKSLLNKHLGNIPDGGGRYGVNQVDGNGLAVVDFSQGGHVNKTQDYIGDGVSFGRMRLASLTGNDFDFAKGGVNKTADHIGAGSSYVISPIIGSPVSIPNASFSQPLDAAGNIPAWALTAGGANAAWVLDTSRGQNATLRSYAGAGYAIATCSKRFSVKPGDSVWLGAWMATPSGTYTIAQANWYNAAGTAIGSPVQPSTTSSTLALCAAIGIAPANAAYFTLDFAVSSPASGYGYGDILSIECRVNDVRVAGSGAVLGNQLNAPNSLTLNYGAARTTTALTATSAGAVSVNAFTFKMGGASVSYNAVSNAVTGLTVGTTYQIYCHDAGGTGGTKTWLAVAGSQTDALSIADDVVVAGQVTIPSSGTSGGGGSGGGCPQVDEPVIRRAPDGSEEVIRSGDVCEGDFLRLSSEHWGLVTHSETVRQPGVRVVGTDGSSITCSASAPLETAEGPCVLAPYVQGLLLKHRRTGVMRVADVIDVGEISVQYITCENDCFWVNDYSHHNFKP